MKKKLKKWLTQQLLTKDTWSKNKRLTVTGVAALAVLIVALIIGGTLYGLSRWLGLTQTNSIKKLVYQAAINDPALIDAGIQALTKTGCSQPDQGYSVEYQLPLRLKEQNGESCTQFNLTGSRGGMATVYITTRKEAKEEVIRQISGSLEYLETNTLPHSSYEASSLYGTRSKQPYQAYVLARSTNSSILIEYFPADPAGLPAVKALAVSLRPLD